MTIGTNHSNQVWYTFTSPDVAKQRLRANSVNTDDAHNFLSKLEMQEEAAVAAAKHTKKPNRII